jgi:hypothetical protein
VAAGLKFQILTSTTRTVPLQELPSNVLLDQKDFVPESYLLQHLPLEQLDMDVLTP